MKIQDMRYWRQPLPHQKNNPRNGAWPNTAIALNSAVLQCLSDLTAHATPHAHTIWKNKQIAQTRWFKVAFLSPSWRSLNLWNCHLTIPKGHKELPGKKSTSSWLSSSNSKGSPHTVDNFLLKNIIWQMATTTLAVTNHETLELIANTERVDFLKQLQSWYIIITNMTMENQWVEDVFSIKNGEFPGG